MLHNNHHGPSGTAPYSLLDCILDSPSGRSASLSVGNWALPATRPSNSSCGLNSFVLKTIASLYGRARRP